MRRFIGLIAMLIIFTFLCGCSNLQNLIKTDPGNNAGSGIKTEDGTKTDAAANNTSDSSVKDVSNTSSETSVSHSIKDFFPFKENLKYSYEGKGNEFASYSMWVDYTKENKIQLRVDNGGTSTVKVLEYKDGELKSLLIRSECYYREDLTSRTDGKEEVLLKEPLAKGTSWNLGDGRKRYISNVDTIIETPAGSFKALEVTTEGNDGKTLDYYGLNTGLIKSIYNSKGSEVTSSLSKIQSNVPFTQSVKFYYPNINDNKIYYTKKTLSFNTNDLTKLVLEKNMKESTSKEVGKLLGPNARIKSLYLGKDNIVYVDFTKELVSEMNAGTSYENMILQCITNTLGEYYGVSKVYITVENAPYSSGHISMKKGDTFTVNTKNSVELKK